MYFECNIPRLAPHHMHPSRLPVYLKMSGDVHTRMQKLNDALDITGLDGATFSKAAKLVFDGSFERFEAMSAEELAQLVMYLHDGQTAEPRMEWPNANVVVDTAFIKTQEWELIRCLSLGGSDAAVVKGISPYRVKRELYHDKQGTPVLIPEEKPTAAFSRGHFLEEEVVKAFCNLTGARRIPETRMFVSKKFPHCTANVDQFISFPDGRIFVYEAKTTIESNFMPWVNDKIPGHYIAQMRQYPAVMDDDRICGTYIGCLFTKDFILNDLYLGSTFDTSKFLSRYIERDKDDERELLEANEQFWADHVDAHMEPAAEGKVETTNHSATDAGVTRRYVGYADKSAPATTLDRSQFECVVEEYLSIGVERSELDAKSRGLKQKQAKLSQALIEELGTHVVGEMYRTDGSFYEVKYSPVSKVETDLEKLELAFPEAYAACVRKNPEAYRVFTIKEKKKKGR